MPLYDIHRTFDSRAASESEGRPLEIPIVYEVRTSAPGATSAVMVLGALEGLGVTIGSPCPDYPPAVCRSRTAAASSDDPALFLVTVVYSGRKPPWDRPPEVSMDFKTEPEYALKDLDDVPRLNTARDPLEQSRPVLSPRATIRIVSRFETWSLERGLSLIGKVNETEWLDQPADTCLIVGCPAVAKQEDGYSFWEIAFSVEVNPKLWIPTKVLNVGRRQLEYGELTDEVTGETSMVPTGKRLIILDETTGDPLPNPSLLAEDGLLIQPIPLPGLEDLELTPYYLEFRDYDRIDFNTLLPVPPEDIADEDGNLSTGGEGDGGFDPEGEGEGDDDEGGGEEEP